MTITSKPVPGDHCEKELPNQGDPALPRRDWPGNMPIAVSVKEFCRLTGLGRTKAYEIISANLVDVRHIGRRTLVLTRSIFELMEGGDEEGTGR